MNIKLLKIVLPLIAAAVCCIGVEAQENRPPNIVFIMADDLGYGHVGYHGQERILTPNIDRMARNGMAFEYCYAGSAVCAPSRDALMTGRHSGHLDRRDNQAKARRDELTGGLVPMPDEAITVAEVLHDTGYATGGFGKWGLGNPGTTGRPDRQGFDLWYGYIDQKHAHNYYTDHLFRATPDGIAEEALQGNDRNQNTTYSADVIHEESLAFIRDNADDPFFAYLAYTLPHGNFEVPELGAYAQTDWPRRDQTYAAMVTRMDRHIGEVLTLLEELGIAENTIVFFTSDHGPVGWTGSTFNGTLGQRGRKMSLYEGGVRVPMVVQWPGTIDAVTSDFIWWHPDFFATALDLAGIDDVPDQVDGMSILPTLLGEHQDPHEQFYFEYFSPFQQSIRRGRWKAIRFGTEMPVELYDLHADPDEANNIADQHAEVTRDLSERMDNARTENRYWPTVERRRSGRNNR